MMSKDKEHKGEMVSISICGGMSEKPLSIEDLKRASGKENKNDNKKSGK